MPNLILGQRCVPRSLCVEHPSSRTVRLVMNAANAEKVGRSMKVYRYPLEPHQDEDTTRYHFAQGSLLLRGLADCVSQIFHEGRPIAEAELRRIHEEPRGMWWILISETLQGIEPATDALNEDVLAAYHSTYSDGTYVVHESTTDDPYRSMPSHFREQTICHLPDFLDGQDWEPRAKSLTVLNEPPHERLCCDQCGDASERVVCGDTAEVGVSA